MQHIRHINPNIDHGAPVCSERGRELSCPGDDVTRGMGSERPSYDSVLQIDQNQSSRFGIKFGGRHSLMLRGESSVSLCLCYPVAVLWVSCATVHPASR